MTKHNQNGFNIMQIKEILEKGNFGEFLGNIEGDYFEGKQPKPYFLESDNSIVRFSARIDLVSDIAAMANLKGGYIVCGVSTDKEKVLKTDKVTEIKLIAKNEFYKQEIIQEVVNTHIEPELKVTVSWHPSSSNAAMGIGSIFIPPQLESKKHFLVTAVEIEGIRQKHFVTIPIRQGSESIWMSAKQIYKLATSKKPHELKQVHDSLSGQIAELRSVVLTGKTISTPADDLKTKIKEVLDVH